MYVHIQLDTILNITVMGELLRFEIVNNLDSQQLTAVNNFIHNCNTANSITDSIYFTRKVSTLLLGNSSLIDTRFEQILLHSYGIQNPKNLLKAIDNIFNNKTLQLGYYAVNRLRVDELMFKRGIVNGLSDGEIHPICSEEDCSKLLPNSLLVLYSIARLVQVDIINLLNSDNTLEIQDAVDKVEYVITNTILTYKSYR